MPNSTDFLIGKIKDSGKVYQCGIQPSEPWPRGSGYEPEQPSTVPNMPCPPPPPVPDKPTLPPPTHKVHPNGPWPPPPEPCHLVDYGPPYVERFRNRDKPPLTLKIPTPDLILSLPIETLGDFQELIKYVLTLNDNWKEVKIGKFTAIHDDEWMHVEIDYI